MSDMRKTSIVVIVQEKLFLTVLFFDSLERLPRGKGKYKPYLATTCRMFIH